MPILPTLWRWWTSLQVRISTCSALMVRYECACTQFVTVHTRMYTVCTGMYLVCTKTLNWRVRWTRGCGSLDVASLAWVAWQSRRLQRSRMLPAKHRTSVGRRLVRVTRAIVPDWNEVWVWTAWVCTCTSPVHTGMYWSVQSVAGQLREDILVTLGCGKWSYPVHT